MLAVDCVRRAEALEVAPEDVEAIRRHRLDALLQLSGGALSGDVLAVARLGLWSLAHDDDARCGRLPFHREMLDAAGVTEVRLVARTATSTRTLYRTFSSTNPYSLDRNRSGALWKAVELPARAWRAFAAGYEPPFDGRPTIGASSAPSTRTPGPLAIGRQAIASAVRVARNRARPAGPLFQDGDTLYRPGQDCAADYGSAFWICRVDALDERHYRETPVRPVRPSWHPGALCTHTYTRAGGSEAMANRIWMPRRARSSAGTSIGASEW